jgi:hypothetical protein
VHIHEEFALDIFGSEATKAGCNVRTSELTNTVSGQAYWTSSKTTLLGW